MKYLNHTLTWRILGMTAYRIESTLNKYSSEAVIEMPSLESECLRHHIHANWTLSKVSFRIVPARCCRYLIFALKRPRRMSQGREMTAVPWGDMSLAKRESIPVEKHPDHMVLRNLMMCVNGQVSKCSPGLQRSLLRKSLPLVWLVISWLTKTALLHI